MKIEFAKKKIFYVIITLMLSIYAYNSLLYFNTYFEINKRSKKEYDNLLFQREKMNKEMQVLRIKIAGLKEESLDKEILKSQAKLILNYIDQEELVIFD
jgi:hypothetical protein